MKTGFVWNERYMWHDTGNAAGVIPAGFNVQPLEHADGPETKRRIKNLLDATDLIKKLKQIDAIPATEEMLNAVHEDAYLSKLEQLNETGGEAGPFVPMGRGSYDIAKLAAGGLIQLTDQVLNGEVDNGYALIRPAGHHAEAGQGIGFCLINNAAIAAKYAINKHGLDRVAIVDWDVHHGNGTESIFSNEPKVLTISVHQDRCFPPDTGMHEVIGEDQGQGYNLNFPLPAGSGDETYINVYERIIVPALEAYKPQLIIVPSGFDAGIFDPLGRQCLTSYGYRSLTKIMMSTAKKLCDNKLVMCHEGGYNPSTVPFHGLAVIEALSGQDSGMEDPFLELHQAMGGGSPMLPYHDEIIQKWRTSLDRIISNW